MISFMETLVITAMAVVLAAVIFYALLVTWQRVWHEDRLLLLSRMLARQGLESMDWASSARASQLGQAVRRCASCSAERQCERWLDSGAREGYSEFCPNAGFIRVLKEDAVSGRVRAIA